MSAILNITADYFNLDKNYFFQNNRNTDAILKKYILIYLIYKNEKNIRLREIVEYLRWNGSDIKRHTSIIHAIKSIDNQILYNSELRMQISDLRSLIKGKDKNKTNVRSISSLIPAKIDLLSLIT